MGNILTGIGLQDRIMKTAEKHGVEPGSYLSELCPSLSDWILSSKSDNTNRSYFNAYRR